MACFHPLDGYQALVDGPGGKRAVVFRKPDWAFMPVRLPCGGCVGCRLERSRQWAVRCMHEASLYDENCFITLTYDDEHLPGNCSLDKGAFPKFMKRLRRRVNERVRYYHCGEYGDRFGRPHLHALLFGWDFRDKVPWSVRGKMQTWRSGFLEELWPFGQSEIGSLTFESAAYVARYVMKKRTGVNAWMSYQEVNLESGELSDPREPEYSTMSRRPGIGKPWLDKYMCEVYPSDGVVMRGRLMKPPRYYDLAYELVDAAGALEVSRERRRARRREDETPERLAVRKQVAEARLSLSERSLEE